MLYFVIVAGVLLAIFFGMYLSLRMDGKLDDSIKDE